jgi:diguanylate cyclase (GGDEF)-like protein
MKIIDELTGLSTWDSFVKQVEECLAKKKDEEYQMIRFDIKNFKFVNAIFGRECGDELLAEIGKTLSEHPYPEEICARLGSDRFVAFIPSVYSQTLIRLISNIKLKKLEENAYQVRIYIGIYKVKDDGASVVEMCDRAGMALGTIKNNLLEKIALYDESIYDKLLKEHELNMALPDAIKKEELQFYLQPQVDRDGKVVGAEALVRWIHPEKGFLMPGEFIPVFEKNYMIVQVDQYIWEKACQLIRKWMDEGRNDIYISINISPKDFECIDVYTVLVGLIKKYRINPSQLKVEITESTIMQNPLKQIQLIGRLRTAGFYVEMDDFGNGYSSISMLKDIDIDAIKLDMRFLSKTLHEDRAEKIMQSIIKLVQEFDMAVIAEGVEKKEQVELLSQMGCDMFQGFYFSKPLPVEDFEKRMFFHQD